MRSLSCLPNRTRALPKTGGATTRARPCANAHVLLRCARNYLQHPPASPPARSLLRARNFSAFKRSGSARAAFSAKAYLFVEKPTIADAFFTRFDRFRTSISASAPSAIARGPLLADPGFPEWERVRHRGTLVHAGVGLGVTPHPKPRRAGARLQSLLDDEQIRP